MIKLAIRDDDANFFTKVEDLEAVYSQISDFPISYAVIPTVLDVSTKGACPDTNGNTTPRYVGDNKELSAWLKDKAQKGECDILLHGINHSYKFIDGKRLAEMQWRLGDTAKEIKKWRKDLSALFDYDITCFVAPSNKITKHNINAVAECGMNFSGIVPMNFQREFTVRNLWNYTKRWILRAKTGLPYPNVMTYSDHKELNACLFISYDYLVKMFNYCKNTKSPMVINVHYWHLRDNPRELAQLVRFVKYACANGAVPSKLTDCF